MMLFPCPPKFFAILDEPAPQRLRFVTTLTEIGMLAYWVLASALVLDLISIDPSLMHFNYQNLVVAWELVFFRSMSPSQSWA
jgi:hypothetical protein